MIRLWLFAPALAISALGASTYWWHMEKDTWQPPRAKLPDLPQVTAFPMRAVPLTKQSLERPLLWTSRRPVLTGEKKTGLAQELEQSRLMAVLESGAERVALLKRADGSVLKITTTSSPWRLESFDGRRAVFVSPDSARLDRPLEAGQPQAGGVPVRRQ